MHYANGREAKLGDMVVGYGYNTSVPDYPQGSEPIETKKLSGVLVKAVPGSDNCNAEIEWVESRPLGAPRPRMAQGEPRVVTVSGERREHWVCRDYTHVGALLHVEDVLELLPGMRSDGHLVPAGQGTTIVINGEKVER